MKYLFFAYILLAGWFFFWFMPRVNDGRIEENLDKVKFWYTYKLKGAYHWRYVPSFYRERIQDAFYPWYNLRKYKFKKYLKNRKK